MIFKFERYVINITQSSADLSISKFIEIKRINNMSEILIQFFGYIFIFCNILLSSINTILKSLRACLFEKYSLQVSQNCLELLEFETSLKYSDFSWRFNETTKLHCFL